MRLRAVLQSLLHPITIFVALQLITIAVAVLWVVYFVDQTALITEAQRAFGENHFDSSFALGALISGCILLGMLIVGIIYLFVNAQKQSHVNHQQRSFISSVTHELRSPLASLQLSAETIQHRQLNHELLHKISAMMIRDIVRLSKLVDQILLSSRLDKGLWLSAPPETFAVRLMLEQCVATAKHLDPKLEQRLELDAASDLVIRQKKQALSTVLDNLLENAVKYSPADTPIKIIAKPQGSHVSLAVCDEGMGLEPKDRKRIFKLFHRAPRATQNAIPGTGLGLFIVNNVVRAIGGTVTVHSTGPSLGSTFTVTIPDLNEKAI